MRNEIGVLLLLLVVAATTACTVSGSDVYRTASSSGREVRLVGELHESPLLPIVENIVALQIHGVPSEFGSRYYVADGFDDPFREAFPTEVWLSDQILRFNWAGRDAFPPRTLMLKNDVHQDVRVLLIGSGGDRFVILDFKSRSTLHIDVLGGGETHIEGIFADGTPVPGRVFPPDSESPHLIAITPDGIRAGDATGYR
jgi:hypothetical protein